MRKQYLQAGEIVSVHGIRGEMKLYPWCDSPDFLKHVKTFYTEQDGQNPYQVEAIRSQNTMVLVKLKGVDTPEAARIWIKKVLWLDRNEVQLPKGRHFVQDLIGMQTVDAKTGEVYGTVRDVQCPAGTDLYEIARPQGGSVLFPAVEEFLDRIDWETDRILIKPIEGMFDDSEN